MAPRSTIMLDDLDRAIEAHPPVDDRPATADVVQQIPLALLVPSSRNPRVNFGAMNELADSLARHGLLQPILARRAGDRYEIIGGHRRAAAAAMLDWPTIGAIVRDVPPDDAYIQTLVENLQRANLSPKEEAAGYETLLRERGWSTHQVAEAVARSQSSVSRRLRVFEDPVLAPHVLANRVPVSVAEETLTLGPADRASVIEQAAEQDWTRADVRRAVRNIMEPTVTPHLPRGFQAALELVLQGVRDAQPGELTDRHIKLLQQLLLQGKNYEQRVAARARARARGRAMPQITASGAVLLAPDPDAPVPTFEGPYRVVPTHDRNTWYVLDRHDREVGDYDDEGAARAHLAALST